MSPVKRTSHAVYDLKYHFVWVPKYRKMILREEIAKRVEEVFGEIAEVYEFEIGRMAVVEDHVHIFLSAPPKLSGLRKRRGSSLAGLKVRARASWISISRKSRGCWPTALHNASLRSATARQRAISTIGCKNVVSNAPKSNPHLPMAVCVPLCGLTEGAPH